VVARGQASVQSARIKNLKSAIVVAAGSSTRMGGKVRKPYLKLRGRPILAWTLKALAHVSGLQQIVLVTRPEDRKVAAAAARLAKLPKRVSLDFAHGGARRQDSVFNGLKAVANDSHLVLIHDAARPFPSHETIEAACAQASESGAAILACRVRDTVKRAADPNGPAGRMPWVQIWETVPRKDLWLAQTPQVFRRDLILALFERIFRKEPEREFTDDAAIFEYFGVPVALIESSETNMKVTKPEDLTIAEMLLKNSK
jgi:2-C-methyl-D-erythritol 4-phosphate cytidylyltransferase